MAKDPAFLFYSSDFLTGVTDLTMEERGQYITILCIQHQKGRLTEKTIRLNVGNVSDDVLSKLTKDDNGLLYSSRLEEVIEERKRFTDSRRNNGLKGGRPKIKPNGYPNGSPNAKPNENLPEDENENEDKSVSKDKSKKFSPPTTEELAKYFMHLTLEPIQANYQAEKFINYYESKGWLVGKAKMKSWQAAARTWRSNMQQFSQSVQVEEKPKVVVLK